ncbi:MAG: hypothetical protein QE278_02570 [Limnobacter sp.]|nr:hypothetical protein [Limnobacter sp.]
MTRENPITRAQGILAVLRNHPDGASLEQIASEMQPAPPNRRALQRWLLDLIEQGRVVRTGKARASRYTLAASTAAKRDHWAYAPEAEYITPGRAKAGGAIRTPMSGPMSGPMNGPMAKLLKLMEAYNPNTSFYLDESLRAQLYAAGTAHKIDGISKRWQVELAWNSCRLDGNTYSLPEAEALLLNGRWAAEKSTYEVQMLLNHMEAIEFSLGSHIEPVKNLDNSGSGASQFEAYTLLNLHALLANNLLPNRSQQMDEHFNLFLETASEISDPFEQAFFVWLHLSHLQLFEGMNAPLARLAVNIPLIHNRLQPFLFTDVPQNLYSQTLLNVYEAYQIEPLRELFVWAYKRSCSKLSVMKSGVGLPDPFKIQYKQAISSAVSDAVLGKINSWELAAFAQQFSIQYVVESDRPQFAKVITQELADLHIGNIARFKLRPREFEAWQSLWTKNS